MRTVLLLVLPLLALSLPGFSADEAQPATETAQAAISVSGQVRELGTRDPVPDAQILDETGETQLAQADGQGHFSLRVSGEAFALVKAVALGHKARKVSLDLKNGEIRDKIIYLEPVDFTGREVVVRGRKERPQISQATLKTREIKKIPGTAGDALRGIQNLPGVVSPNDMSGALIVRGGGPADNLYLLDNIPWPTPYHFGGIVSTINPDLLTDVDLYAGGFPARWGDAQGAVLDCRTRPGKKDGLHGRGEVSLITANGLLESPLGLGDASLTLSGRRSYFDLILPKVMDTSQFTAFPRFWDSGGTLDFSLSPNDKFRGLVLASDDLMSLSLKPEDVNNSDFIGEIRMEEAFQTGGLTWTHTCGEDFTSVVTPFCYRTLEDFAYGSGFSIRMTIVALGIKDENTWDLGRHLGMSHELGFGGMAGEGFYEAGGFVYTRSVGTAGGSSTSYNPQGITATGQALQTGAFLQDRIGFLPGWWLTVGGRYDRHSMAGRDTTTPRLGLEWKYDERTLWKAAWGYYDQFPSGQDMSPQYGNPNLFAQRCEHAVLELEKKFMPGLMGRVSGYYKSYRDMVSGLPLSDPLPYGNVGEGDARGLELYLKQDLGEKFFAWASYAWSLSERKERPDTDWRLYRYDQPQVATLVASYSPRPQLSLGAKLHYNSGPLSTPLVGRYPDTNPKNLGGWAPIWGQPFSQRLPDYLRLDLRTDYTWLFEGWKLGIYFEILNVFNRENPMDMVYKRDYSEGHTVNNLPRFPYFGVEAEF